MKVGATVVSLLAFQVLAVIGAGAAGAITAASCTYNAGTKTVTITQDASNQFEVYVNVVGEIRVWQPAGPVAADCGSATTSNTTNVDVLGGAAVTPTNEVIEIQGTGGPGLVGDPPAPAECCSDFTNQNFSVDLGEANPGTDTDIFSWVGSSGGDTVTLGGSQNSLTGTVNGGNLIVTGADNANPAPGVVVPGLFFFGGTGGDTIDGADTTARTWLIGDAGADTVMPGLGPDIVAGGNFAGGPGQVGDKVVYDRPGNISVSEHSAGPFTDADDGQSCTDDTTFFATASQSTCEGDEVYGFQIVESDGATGNDYLEGDESAAVPEIFLPGPGDDHVDGNAGTDVIAWSGACTGPVSIDTANGTTTGCGTDTWQEVEGVAGSPAGEGSFDNKAGVINGGDTIDASGETGPVVINLAGGATAGLSTLSAVVVNTPAVVNVNLPSIENAIGSPGNDTLVGDAFRNVLLGGDGNDVVSGAGGNDVLAGQAGNDTYSGGGGNDEVYFGFSSQGVTADLSRGYAEGEGDDSFAAFVTTAIDVETVYGSNFNDDITGGLTGLGSAINFLFVGKDGNDNLTGSDSNDTLKGGKGDDVMRGGQGLDTLKGAQGEDWGYGGGGKDICSKSTEHQRSC